MRPTSTIGRPPSTLVIFGASGDLARRKLLPGVANLARGERLPEEFAVVGVGRSDLDDEAFRQLVSDVAAFPPRLLDQLRFVHGSYAEPRTYEDLEVVLGELDATAGTAGNRLFYLATPPAAFPQIVSFGRPSDNLLQQALMTFDQPPLARDPRLCETPGKAGAHESLHDESLHPWVRVAGHRTQPRDSTV